MGDGASLSLATRSSRSPASFSTATWWAASLFSAHHLVQSAVRVKCSSSGITSSLSGKIDCTS
eukprot:6647447-Prymnesium_polylepis.1